MPMGGPGPGGRNPAGVKPKNVKQSFSRILSYFGKNKFLLLIVFVAYFKHRLLDCRILLAQADFG